MKKFLTSRFAVLSGIVAAVFPTLASAQPTWAPIWTTAADFFYLGCTIIDVLFGVLVFLTIFFVALAAYKYLTSGGEPDKVKDASAQILYAAVAIVVALVAKGFPTIVGSLVSSPTLTITIFGGCM